MADSPALPAAAAAIPKPPDVRPGFVAVGVVLTSFGLKGDIKVEPLTDFPARFAAGARLWLAGVQRTVERSRWQRGIVYVKLTDIAGPEGIAPLRGYYFEIVAAERATLAPGEFYRDELIGLAVVTTTGEELGSVLEFQPSGGNDVLVVHGARGDILIPLIEDVIRSIDVAAGRILIEAVDGLLPDAPRAKPERTPPARLQPWRRRRQREQSS